MFAILSWLQEGGTLPSKMGWDKGLLACFFGAILYLLLPKNLDK